ncbi:MAG: hypothetical protein AAFW81_01270 [Pseudomonadota bacterium]
MSALIIFAKTIGLIFLAFAAFIAFAAFLGVDLAASAEAQCLGRALPSCYLAII